VLQLIVARPVPSLTVYRRSTCRSYRVLRRRAAVKVPSTFEMDRVAARTDRVALTLAMRCHGDYFDVPRVASLPEVLTYYVDPFAAAAGAAER